jgi:hypothetical protein
MLTEINPKLPMRDKAVTREFYLTKLGFEEFGSADFDGYLMVKKTRCKFTSLPRCHYLGWLPGEICYEKYRKEASNNYISDFDRKMKKLLNNKK